MIKWVNGLMDDIGTNSKTWNAKLFDENSKLYNEYIETLKDDQKRI